MEQEFATGCIILPEDERDFSYEVLGAENVTLPDEFEVDIPFFFNQKKIDACVAMATATAKSFDEHEEQSPRFLWGLCKAAEQYIGYGTSFQQAMKILTTIGSVPYGTLDESTDVTRDQYMRFELTEDLKAKAVIHKALSYWRAPTWQMAKQALFEQKKSLVSMCDWHKEYNTPMNGFISPPASSDSTGHMFSLRGWGKLPTGEEYAKFRNSWGQGWGKSADFYAKVSDFPLLDIRLFFVLVDMPVEKAKLVQKYDKKLIKNPNKPEVYYVSKGKIAWINNEAAFEFGRNNGWWGDWADIIEIPDEITKDLTI